MAGGGGTTTQQSSGSSQNIQQIPAWMSNAGQQNYALAQDIANRPLQQYQGAMVADTSPQTQQAWNLAAQSGGVGQPAYNASQAAYLSAIGASPGTISPNYVTIGGAKAIKGVGNAMSISSPGNAMQVSDPGSAMQVSDPGNAMQVYNPGMGMQVYNPGVASQVSSAGDVGDISAANLRDTNLDPYMNPYTQSVINTTLPIMQQNLGLQQNQAQNQAASSNAYGGSRQGVQQGVTQAQGALNMAQMAEQLNQANFQQAQAGATGDINRQAQVAATNQANWQTNYARQLQAAGMNQASQQTDLARAMQAQLANQNVSETDLARMASMQLANQQSQQTDLARALQSQGMNQASQQTDLARALQSQGMNQASQQTDLARAYAASAANQQSQQMDLARGLQTQLANQANQQQNLTRNLQGQLANQGVNLTAQQANQQANLAKINANLAAAGGLSNVGQAQQRGLAGQYAMLTGAGAAQQQQQQDQINAQMAKFNQAYNYPQQGLGTMISTLGMTPHDVSQFGTNAQQSSATTPPDYGLIGQNSLGALGNIYSMSDPKVKTAITPMGKDPITGVPVKAFRFKGEPAGMPKVVGPLAGDVAKIAPAAVAKIGGVKHVLRPALAAATPSVAHLPNFAANTMRGPLGKAPAARPRVLGALGGR